MCSTLYSSMSGNAVCHAEYTDISQAGRTCSVGLESALSGFLKNNIKIEFTVAI